MNSIFSPTSTEEIAAIKQPILLHSPSRLYDHFPTIPIKIRSSNDSIFFTSALLDSGATSLYVSSSFISSNAIPTRPLPRPLQAYNADDTINKSTILDEAYLTIEVNGHVSSDWFFVTELGTKDLVVGMTWLREHNPLIDWQTGKISFKRCPSSCGSLLQTLNNLAMAIEVIAHEDYETQEINEVNQYKPGSHLSTTLAMEEFKNKKVLTLEDIKAGPFADYIDVFEESGFQNLPPHRKWDHAIDLKEDWEQHLWKPRVYPLTWDETQELDTFLEENLKNGRIRPSKSPLASPVFFIKKKTGDKRMVIDYRKLNDITKKNAYPLPLAEDIVYKWQGCKYFSTLDVKSGYYNVRMKEGDEWKTAFITKRGLFESLVMTFGLCNAPATFQNMMEDIFIVQIRRGDAGAFIDDIGIGTKSDSSKKLGDEDFHIKVCREILQIFREQGLYLKASKCEFLKATMHYLGFIVSGNSVSMDPIKVAPIKEWPIPSCLKDVRSFMGFINFYRRFIHDFATKARPLNDLTKKDVDWHWDTEQQSAFDSLKEAMITAPVLALPNQEKAFRVETDASNVAYGAVLAQQNDEEEWHPVAFLSHSLNDTQRNYDTHDKELLAIVEALKHWRHFLLGSKFPVTVLTDHNNLLYFRKTQDLNRRQARWAQYLEHFPHLILKHRAGALNVAADALSRRADYGDGKGDNKGMILLPEKLFEIDLCIASIEPFINRERSFRDLLYFEQAQDPLILSFNLTKEGEKLPMGWGLHEDLWAYWNKIYIPSPLRQTVFRALHSSPTAGHPGRDATLELIRRDYYWPGLRSNIEEWVRNCDICQRTKALRHKPHGELKPVDPVTERWKVVTTDFITGLPSCRGSDAIWTATDKGTKMVHLAPTVTTLDSEGSQHLYLDRVWKLHGTQAKIITDRGPQFASRFTKDIHKHLGIQTALSTAYHPQTDGQSERTNQEVEQVLRTVVAWHQDDWVDWLPLVEFALNNRYKKALGTTPFYANYGFHPQIGSLPRIDTPIDSVENFVKHIQTVQSNTKLALLQAAEEMKKFYDRHRGKTPVYAIGQKVLLDNADLRLNRPTRKLTERRSGPFVILERIGTHAYKLDLPLTWKTVHPVFHVSKLEPYHEDPQFPNFPQPPPDVLEGEPEWEVEEVLDSKLDRSTLKFLVKWKGWSISDNSWEPEDNLTNSHWVHRTLFVINN